MNAKTMVEMVVGVAVGVLILTAALFPIIDEATETEGTITNTGYYRMSEISEKDSWTITWDSATPRVADVNGTTVTLNPEAGGIPFTLIGGNDLMVRYYLQSNNVRFWVQTFSTGNSVYAADSNSNQDMTITYDGTTVVCDNGSGTTLSITITDKLYAVDPNGDYIVKKPTDKAMVKSDSEILGLGTTALANNIDQRFVIEGTIADGFTADYEPYDTMTMGDITVVAPEHVGTYLGVYDFEKLTFTVTYNASDLDVTYSQVLVPYKVTAELASHATQDEIELLETIPILITVGLIMGIVGVIAARRFE